MHRPLPSKCRTARRRREVKGLGTLQKGEQEGEDTLHPCINAAAIDYLSESAHRSLSTCSSLSSYAWWPPPLPPRSFLGDSGRPYYGDGKHIAILSQSQEGPDGARFRYAFQTENGINVEARGTPGSKGQSNIDGSFSFPFPEGGTGSVSYVADENGYRPESPLIPTPHPLPAHAIEQIRFAQSQGRSG
ncbi:hypothetical protein O3P69_014088 [Scylla paramamosain]|uniref:Uncharacterized protein n=1 Tax=Scylla paramamosain TaxID=85552 RepID=A0AAW0SSY2_SCYPA